MTGLTGAPRDIADSIGFGVVFPYMGFAIHGLARATPALAKPLFERM